MELILAWKVPVGITTQDKIIARLCSIGSVTLDCYDCICVCIARTERCCRCTGYIQAAVIPLIQIGKISRCCNYPMNLTGNIPRIALVEDIGNLASLVLITNGKRIC